MEVFSPACVWIVFSVICLESAIALQRYYMEDSCESTIDMAVDDIPAGRLAVSKRVNYRNRLNCHVTIMAPEDMQLVIVFRELEIEWEVSCDDDFVQLFDGTSMEAPMVRGLERRLCGHRVPSGSYVTTGDALTVFFQSDVFKQDDGFEIVFTAFHKSNPCFEGEFKCDNGRCIEASLECNNFQHCGDGSDQCQVSAEVMMGIILSVFLLTVVGVGAITIYRKKKKRRSSTMGKSKDDMKSVPLSKTCSCGNEVQKISHEPSSPRTPVRKWQPFTFENTTAVWTTNIRTASPYQPSMTGSEQEPKQEILPKLKRASV